MVAQPDSGPSVSRAPRAPAVTAEGLAAAARTPARPFAPAGTTELLSARRLARKQSSCKRCATIEARNSRPLPRWHENNPCCMVCSLSAQAGIQRRGEPLDSNVSNRGTWGRVYAAGGRPQSSPALPPPCDRPVRMVKGVACLIAAFGRREPCLLAAVPPPPTFGAADGGRAEASPAQPAGTVDALLACPVHAEGGSGSGTEGGPLSAGLTVHVRLAAAAQVGRGDGR